MLFFIDESGTDHGDAPYEVLAAVSIREHDLWNIVKAVHDSERKHFGTRLGDFNVEIKGKKLLKRKTFRQASKLPSIDPLERTAHALAFLNKNANREQPGIREFTSYAQAKIDFVRNIFDICASFGVKVFASIVDINAPTPQGDMLRKDYAYLFERFYYFLELSETAGQGLIVFDELEKTQSKILLNQMRHYFIETFKGVTRSARIVPEPFFVHSDLTTAVQIADIIAYCLNWSFRLEKMNNPVRDEIKEFADRAFELSFKGRHVDGRDGNEYPVYGITYIDDLRPQEQRQ